MLFLVSYSCFIQSFLDAATAQEPPIPVQENLESESNCLGKDLGDLVLFCSNYCSLIQQF